MKTFILTADSLAAQAVRQQLASKNTLGVKVGNFSALLDFLAEYYLLVKPECDWQAQVHTAAKSMKNAFWSESLKADEKQVLSQVQASLELMLSNLPLCWTSVQTSSNAPKRLQAYFAHIAALWSSLPNALRPAEQLLAREFILTKEEPIEPLQVQSIVPLDSFFPWQREVLEKLKVQLATGETFKTERVAELAAWQNYFLNGDNPNETRTQPEPFAFFSARDVAAECYAVASMVQKQLEQPGIEPEHLAIMLPSQSADCLFWLNYYCDKAGIALSNNQPVLAVESWQRKLIRDLLTYQLHNQPLVQLQSIVTNPCMPWSRKTGHYLAKRLARVSDRKWIDNDENQEFIKSLMSPLAQPRVDALFAWLEALASAIPAKGFAKLLIELESIFASLSGIFDEQVKQALIQWDDSPKSLVLEGKHRLKAVTLLTPEHSLYSPVERLWLMGFNQGAYEEPVPNSGAIAFEYWQGLQLSSDTTVSFSYPHSSFPGKGKAWLNQLAANLGQSKQQIIVSCARQSLEGAPLYVSNAWIYFARALSKDLGDAESLMKPIEIVRHELLHWQTNEVSPLEKTTLEQLNLNHNIFDLNAQLTQSKEHREESPSSLETLLVSPFAWLLNRLGIESQEWEEQGIDVRLQGTIAHKVFELYKTDANQQAYSEALFDQLFNKAIEEEAVQLLEEQWRIEKAALRNEVHLAFKAFVPWLLANDWEIVEVEKLYRGKLSNPPYGEWNLGVKGFVDAIIRNKESTLILDYKKSKSDDRLTRLSKGFDLQIAIYRELYRQAYSETPQSDILITGYYNLNDRIMVTDTAVEQSADLEVKTPDMSLHEQSAEAIKEIEQRLKELRDGIVLMRTKPEKEWKKMGITPYALDNGLVKRFSHDEAAPQGEK